MNKIQVTQAKYKAGKLAPINQGGITMQSEDVVKFTSEVREFINTASQNGKIPDEKMENIIGMLENAKQTALAEGKNTKPIDTLIQEIRAT